MGHAEPAETGDPSGPEEAAPKACGEVAEAELQVGDEIGRHLIRLMRVMGNAHAQVVKANPEGMEKAAFILLCAVVEHGPLRSGELAEKVHADPSTISRQVAQLVKAGLVERQADPADGRASVLVVTDAGLRLLERNRRLRGRHIALIVSDWPEPDRRRFAELLGRYATSYENYLPTLIAELVAEARSGGEN
ncbi:MarR family winged helix-turn-helix transcriptional regulator [Streptoalloteichus hindustanus]|uniref:Transcriptional regulator, MarR family n=1 Tax=Streptoalloteichus hindustanus TaxID=2017 RepID=A0A1M4VYA3_STRHI|nr:MarR family winged helix-turn-helix transcriptional regulator [Streptoalloteichus hindustanus]SHE73958.1 transcriptional regulator, MarR family [Streptoalloteichus hindustanus]